MVQTLILITAAATYFLDCITFIERYVSEDTYIIIIIYIHGISYYSCFSAMISEK